MAPPALEVMPPMAPPACEVTPPRPPLSPSSAPPACEVRPPEAAAQAAERAVERLGCLRRSLGGGISSLRGSIRSLRGGGIGRGGGLSGGVGDRVGGLSGGFGRGGFGCFGCLVGPRGVGGGDGEDTGGELGGVARGGAADDRRGATGTGASRRGRGDPLDGGHRQRCHGGHD